MLCTARVYRSRNKPKGNNDYYEPGFRTNRDIVYAVSFGNKPNAFFDIASFMYNIIDVKRCYGRFKYGKVFLKKCRMAKMLSLKVCLHHLDKRTWKNWARKMTINLALEKNRLV